MIKRCENCEQILNEFLIDKILIFEECTYCGGNEFYESSY